MNDGISDGATNGGPAAVGAHRAGRRRLLAGAAALAGGAALGVALDGGRASAETVTSGSTMTDSSALVSTLSSSTQSTSARAIRTPDSRFANLPDYPFTPNYVQVSLGDGSGNKLRMHYLDEKPSDPTKWSGETIVLLHGNPSWSYLYRNVIPKLVAAGHRCIAPDLIGFGKSDKPIDRFLYTYKNHQAWLTEALFTQLNLTNVTLVCHDWGGMLGLRVVADNPSRFRRVVPSNTKLAEGGADLGPGWAYLAQWLQFTQRTEDFDPSQIIENFTLSTLSPEVRAAYNAPYISDASLHGVRRFAVLIPITAYDEANPDIRRAWSVLETLQIPVMTAFSDQDHVTHGDSSAITSRIPGAQGRTHPVIANAAHFVQEDQPAAFAAVINDFIAATK